MTAREKLIKMNMKNRAATSSRETTGAAMAIAAADLEIAEQGDFTMIQAEKLKLVDDLECAGEIIVADHDMHNEYLTDAEREWIVTTLKSAIAADRS